MSDSDGSGKNPGVPSWQVQSKPAETKGTAHAVPAPASRERETVVEQAKKFLQEDEVRNASTDKKIAFLAGKGLNNGEIDELLGVTRNEEATAPASETPQPSEAASAPPTIQPSYTSQQSRDTPPIITYPEFLTTPQSPSPLVTKSRLLTTLYLFGGLSALLYGTNTYLIEPMLASLSSSRLSLAETTTANLQKLINKLEGIVSEIPPAKNQVIDVDKGGDEDSDEDPTEMFHRDIGIQTSLPVTPSLSRPASPAPETTHLSGQTARLTSLNTLIAGLVEDSTSEAHDSDDLSTTINILREYLDGLAYVAISYGYGNSYGGILGNSNAKDRDDEIGRVKASIRGVKGVLLSARSFPGAGAMRAR